MFFNEKLDKSAVMYEICLCIDFIKSFENYSIKATDC